MTGHDSADPPLGTPELSARLRALRRRTAETAGGARRIIIRDLEISPAAGTVTLAGRPLRLTKTEFRLLCTLARAPGIVHSREQLLQEVWEYEYFGDTRIVDVHIGRLRRKLEPDPTTPDYVITVRGMGYKLQP